MKIVIDARMYGLEHAGIGRYVANLISEIKNQKSTHSTSSGLILSKVEVSEIKKIKITLLVRKKNLEEIKQEFGNTFGIVVCDVPHYSLREQFVVPFQLIKLEPDLVHFPHFNVPFFYRGKYLVTIHDLIKHSSVGKETTTRNQWFYWFKYLTYRFVFGMAVKRARKILVPSFYVKNDLLKHYSLDKEKIVVTYEGIDEKFLKTRKSKEEILEKYKIKKPFVIYTGSVYPHKNIERLMKAIKLLNANNPPNGINLAIVCARGVFEQRLREKIKEIGGESNIFFLGFVPDEDLIFLYKEARAFVFPTLSEGFGLPGLEAMICELPVVCSDIRVLKEVYEEAAIYFDSLSVDDMAKKIRLVCEYDQAEREKMVKKGLNQIKKYSWEKMAQETLAVYQDLL